MKPSLNSGSRKYYNFPGGINPPANKERSLRSVIMDAPIPEFLFFPLKQNKGPDATPVVSIGDTVQKGQLLAKSESQFGVSIHASTSGTVKGISPGIFPDEFGNESNTICIETDGKDAWIARQTICDFQQLEPKLLLEKIQQAGINGLGGAGFPIGKKFSSDNPISTLIINAAECEPYITCDQALIREYPESVVIGTEILQRICQAQRCLIAIEEDKRDAINALSQATQNSEVELVIIPAKYPTGSEKQLIQVLTNKQVPNGRLPEDIGILTTNAGNANAVHDAVLQGEPLITRITTVCGDTLKTPKNFRVLMGTPVSFLLNICGVDYASLSRVIVGGSLMGFTLNHLEVPIIKTTNCLVAGSLREFPPAPPALACIRCGYCTTACPAGLMPQLLYDQIRSNNTEKAKQYGLDDCIECGACAYVCPSHIPLVQYYRAAKFEVEEHRLQLSRSEKRKQRFEFRQERIKLNEKRKKGNRRRSLARPESLDTIDTALENFSRESAKQEIADAVARVKARRNTKTAGNNKKSKISDGDKP